MKTIRILLFSIGTLLSVQAASQSFTAIEISSLGKVIFTQSNEVNIKSENGNGDQPLYSIQNNTLVVDGVSGTLNISSPSLKQIVISGKGSFETVGNLTTDELKIKIGGDGKVTVNQLNTPSLEVLISGLGKVSLSGSAENAKYTISGSGKVDAVTLKTKTANANISGVGKCDLDVTDYLNANISGSGTVNYISEPKELDKNISGIGKIGNTTIVTETRIVERDTTQINLGETELVIISKKDSSARKKTESIKPIWQGLELGFNGFLNKDFNTDLPSRYEFMSLNNGKSIAFSLNLLQKDFKITGNFFFLTGLGVSWNNYRFDDNVTILNNNADNIIAGTYDTTSNINYKKSKLTVSYVTAPLLFQVYTGKTKNKSFHIGTGMVLGYRIGSHTKQKYDEGGKTSKPKNYDDFGLNPFRASARVDVGYGSFNLFAEYALTDMFRASRGPQINPFTLGLTLAQF